MATETLLTLDLPGIKKLKSGKVREIFDLGNAFLFVASDRISAFDCVMPNGIPRKGEVLTQISHFWFDQTEAMVPNHRLAKADTRQRRGSQAMKQSVRSAAISINRASAGRGK